MKILFENISHFELCKKTAEWQLNKSRIILYEYQSYATEEFPDVLCFKNGYTWLFEIKIQRSDFLKDDKKDCRRKFRIKYFPRLTKNKLGKICGVEWENSWCKPHLQEFIQKYPHLGRIRYYVCPAELIFPEEIKNGFGLYWFNGIKFRKKKESKFFKSNIYDELRILEHAFRKFYCGDTNNVLINGYK